MFDRTRWLQCISAPFSTAGTSVWAFASLTKSGFQSDLIYLVLFRKSSYILLI